MNHKENSSVTEIYKQVYRIFSDWWKLETYRRRWNFALGGRESARRTQVGSAPFDGDEQQETNTAVSHLPTIRLQFWNGVVTQRDVPQDCVGIQQERLLIIRQVSSIVVFDNVIWKPFQWRQRALRYNGLTNVTSIFIIRLAVFV